MSSVPAVRSVTRSTVDVRLRGARSRGPVSNKSFLRPLRGKSYPDQLISSNVRVKPDFLLVSIPRLPIKDESGFH